MCSCCCLCMCFVFFFFFFQAEDGIRDWSVTGVQTCALPICRSGRRARGRPGVRRSVAGPGVPRGARMNSRLRPADRAAPDYWLMPHRDVRRILPRLSLTLLLAWLVLYPILVAVADAARGAALGPFVSRPGASAALWASVWVSLASVVLAAAIGVPLGLLFG